LSRGKTDHALIQGMFPVAPRAMLRGRIQIPELGFELDVFDQDSPQCPPHVAIGARQNLINGIVNRIIFHRTITAAPGGGSAKRARRSVPCCGFSMRSGATQSCSADGTERTRGCFAIEYGSRHQVIKGDFVA
jgi:hypothetical protein